MDFPEDKIVVNPYSREFLANKLSIFSNTEYEEVLRKNHLEYLDGYLKHRDVANIVIEYPYTDRDYLQDYSAYYARSFSSDYTKKAMRIHFFRKEVTESIILAHLEKRRNNHRAIQEAYIGSMVVKPIPQRMIGKTLVSTYPESNGEGRIYPIKRQYFTHLFGIELVLDTIGYQEQDRSVAACATSALWSVFQSTALLFQHPIPSPAEITEMASRNAYIADRSFPSRGLTMEQIATCVKAVKLEPQCYDVYNYHVLKAYIKAYLHAQIPMLMGVSLYSLKEEKFLGEHAVAVNGFSAAGKTRSNFYGEGNHSNRLYLFSSRIDKIFVHDDQVGPFAKMGFDDPAFRLVSTVAGSKKTHYASLSTSWKPADHEAGSIRAVPNTIMIPLYHKIRITFDDILLLVDNINFHINDKVVSDDDLPDPGLTIVEEWDIVLDRNSEFKKRVFEKQAPFGALKGKRAQELLTKSLPLFFWRAVAYADGDARFEIIFDSTDIAEGKLFLEFISYDDGFCSFLKTVLENNMNIKAIRQRQVRHCMNRIMESLPG